MRFTTADSLNWLFGNNWHRRIFKDENGDISHDLYIDFCEIQEVFSRFDVTSNN